MSDNRGANTAFPVYKGKTNRDRLSELPPLVRHYVMFDAVADVCVEPLIEACARVGEANVMAGVRREVRAETRRVYGPDYPVSP